MNKLKLDLPLVLPPDAAHADPCVDRLLAVLRGRPGVIDAHIDGKEGERHLCVHFDADRVAPSAVEKMVGAAGAELASKFGHIHVAVRDIRHERQARIVEAALLREPGVLYAAVSFGARQVAIEFNPGQLTPEQARGYVRKAGLEIVAGPGQTGHAQHGPKHDEHKGHGHKHDEHEGHGHKHDEHKGHGHKHDGHGHDEHEHDEHEHDGHDHGHDERGHDGREGHEHGRDANGHEGHDHGHDDHGRAGHDHGHKHDAHEHDDHGHHDHGHHDHGHGHHGHGHGHAHGGLFGEQSELIFALLCGVLTAAGALCAWQGVPFAAPVLYGLAYAFGGWFLLREAVQAIRAGVFEIEFLMLVAALGAAALGEPFEGALLLFLFSLGHSLEHWAMDRARQALSGLTKLVPDTAVRIVDGAEASVSVAELRVGDRLLVKPNTRIPADGVVARGASSVDQAPITGESTPVEKQAHPDPAAALTATGPLDPAHRVYAGSINGAGALELLVLHVAADSTLARVVRLVTEAQTQKSPTQEFTDRFERIFVPVILGFVGLLMFAWVVVAEPFAASFYRAMAVLVAASPCALAIATPSAVLAGVGRAARGGVLIKGGAHLDALGSVGAIAFDKTGTLTEGEPRLTDVVAAAGVDPGRMLALAAALERRSDHPLARAVVEGAATRQAAVLAADEVVAITGFGLRGRADGAEVKIGKPGLFAGEEIPAGVLSAVTHLQDQGRTVMLIKHGAQFLGALGVMDTPRPSARGVLERLRVLGVTRTIMLTGDNQRVADAVAREVGIVEARGDLLPEHKVDAVAELARASTRVAMVGDGVNDAPALASATVGIAMGAGGSDVALETADIALMSDDLHGLPFAVGLSQACRRVIRQNLWASLGMVAILVPATVSGVAGIGVAVVLHEGSTLLVVVNALRLLAYRDDRPR